MAAMTKPLISGIALRIFATALGTALLTGTLSAQGIQPQPITIDASAPTAEPGPANYTYDTSEAKSPDGHVLGLNAQYLTLDGKPWLPVMGEMH
jgi:beta-galactosidase